MKLYEYQAKAIFENHGIPIPPNRVISNPEEAPEAFKELEGSVALKSQVLVGGRGKAGGIKFANTPQEAVQAAEELLKIQIKGEKVQELLVEKKLDIISELYVSVVVDRSARKGLIIASSQGGVDIEDVARETPEKIIKFAVNPLNQFMPYQARDIARKMGMDSSLIPGVGGIIWKLYNIFQKYDANLVEINPLVITKNGIIAADGKMDLDDDALYRHPEFAIQTGKDEFAYVKLNGDIAVIGNGAGLTLSGMDLLNLYGGRPATFLDIGGGASQENIARALKLVISEPQVKVIFLNVLGGITRADDVARGVLDVLEESERKIPLVIRLTGTNEEEGQRLLSDAGISYETSMEKAARKAVELCNKID